MAVYGYTRVSTNQQSEDGNSLEVQQRQLEGWCLIDGSTMDEVFVEQGVSGSIPIASRPEGSRVIDALGKGDTLVACKLDRMFRSALDALQVTEQLKRKGVRLVLLDLGGEVTEGMSKLLLTVSAAFAEAERDRIRDRIKTSKRFAKEQGRYLGGKVPFGYTVGPHGALREHPGQQAIIGRLRELAPTMSIRKARLAVIEEHGVNMSLATAARIIGE